MSTSESAAGTPCQPGGELPSSVANAASSDPVSEGRQWTPLWSRGFCGFVATQFFGAFNDNLFKQLLLLLAVPSAAAIAAGAEAGPDLQGVATIVFGLPFVVLAGIAGFLSDRTSKRSIIIASKSAEIVVMVLGTAAFLATPWVGFYGLWVVLFLMGLQSTFFGPAKYGILPEMLHEQQLPRANGVILMTTFVAIIIGTAVAGPLKDALVDPAVPGIQASQQLWMASLVCIGIAVVGTVCSLVLPRVHVAEPGLTFRKEYLLIPKPMLELLRRDRPLLLALFASCLFWLIAGLTIQAVNSLGKTQLQLSDTKTSLMVSLISVGIAGGGLAAGYLTRRLSSGTVVVWGMWGVVIFCAILSISLPGGKHLLGFIGSIPMLMLMGAAAAFFAIPIQVFLQSRPPEELKGRMIAIMNQANFLAIVISGVLYIALDQLITATGLPRSALFGAMAILFLPLAVFYRMR
ncbi:MAG: MFS transporter [Planctomycetota bacterium]